MSNKCISEVIEEFQFVSSLVSGTAIQDIVKSYLMKHECVTDDLVIPDLV